MCFESATAESLHVHLEDRDIEDSIYVFATPVVVDESLRVIRNRAHLSVLGSTIMERSLVEIDESSYCRDSVANLWKDEGPLFRWSFRIWFGPIAIGFEIGAYWQASLDLEYGFCYTGFTVSAALIPSAHLQVYAEGSVWLLIFQGLNLVNMP